MSVNGESRFPIINITRLNDVFPLTTSVKAGDATPGGIADKSKNTTLNGNGRK